MAVPSPGLAAAREHRLRRGCGSPLHPIPARPQVKNCTRFLGGKDAKAGSSIDKLREMGPAGRRESLPKLTEAQQDDIDVFLANFPEIEISFDARVEDEEDVQESDVLNLTVKVERKHLAEDPDWIDSDDEDDEPDQGLFDKQLAHLQEGTEEYDSKKDELMDEWRDAYFERQKRKREREKTRNPQAGELGFAAKPLHEPVSSAPAACANSHGRSAAGRASPAGFAMRARPSVPRHVIVFTPADAGSLALVPGRAL